MLVIRVPKADVRHQRIIPVPDMVLALGAEFPHQLLGVIGDYHRPAFRTYDPELDHGSHLLCAALRYISLTFHSITLHK